MATGLRPAGSPPTGPDAPATAGRRGFVGELARRATGAGGARP